MVSYYRKPNYVVLALCFMALIESNFSIYASVLAMDSADEKLFYHYENVFIRLISSLSDLFLILFYTLLSSTFLASANALNVMITSNKIISLIQMTAKSSIT